MVGPEKHIAQRGIYICNAAREGLITHVHEQGSAQNMAVPSSGSTYIKGKRVQKLKNITVSMNMCIVRKRAAFFHGGVMRGLPFLFRIVYKKVRDWTAGHSLLLQNEIMLRSKQLSQAYIKNMDGIQLFRLHVAPFHNFT